MHDVQKAAVGTFAALTIASSAVTNVLPANALTVPPVFTSSTMVAEKVTREGVYGEYSVDVLPQKYDDARSTYKSATETKSKKGKHRCSIVTLSPTIMLIPFFLFRTTFYFERKIHGIISYPNCW